MQKVMATYRDGTVIFDLPVDWPDGTRIEIAQVGPVATNGAGKTTTVRPELLAALSDPDRYGLDESLWPNSPEEIALLVQHMEAAEPLRWSSEELAKMEADRIAEKERQKELTRAVGRNPTEREPRSEHQVAEAPIGRSDDLAL